MVNKQIKKRITIKKLSLLRMFFGTHNYKIVLELDGKIIDWGFKLGEDFTEEELDAIKEFSNEHSKKIPAGLIYDINFYVDHLTVMKQYRRN